MSPPRLPDAISFRLLRGTYWLALQILLQIFFSLWSLRLILEAAGPAGLGAYRFAFGFGVIQAVAEAGAGAALHRQLAACWARADRSAFDRTLAAGLALAAATAMLQQAAFLAGAALAVPHARFAGEAGRLVVACLWIQAFVTPFLAAATVTSGVLQAARRYSFVAVWELAITVVRFGVLAAGVASGVAFVWVVAAQQAVIAVLRLGPGLWATIRVLGGMPWPRGARWADCRALAHFGMLAILVQAGVLLGDKADVAVLGFVRADPGPEIALYDVVSKPYLLLRQAGTMLAAMVVPAVAGLAAAGDEGELDRVKYDGPRLHAAVLLPVGLLAWLEAGPFLTLWFGRGLGYDASAAAPLMRLMLAAALPLLMTIPVQATIGLGRVRFLAIASLAGVAVNLPLSVLLAWHLGVAGVIWSTILTALVADLLVPALYVGRVLGLDARILLSRTLGAPLAGGVALVAASWGVRRALPASADGGVEGLALRLALHLGVGLLAFLAGYAATPTGRGDLGVLLARRRPHEAEPGRPF